MGGIYEPTSDFEYPIYALFWALNGLWNIITANWLLTVSVALIFVNFGVSVITKTYKGKEKEGK